jgi:acetyltransferase-like isoleucine patch superfamily enzyme
METTLRELAIGLGIADAIKFVGGIYDPVELGRILLSAGVYVLAGMGGISINDAMCFGLPIVCSICDGTEKILVRDGQNGTYFNSGDEVDLAEKIKWIIGDPKRWKTMSEASTSIIRNEININTLLSAYQAVFNTVKTRTNKSVLNRLAPVWFKLALSSFMVQKYKKIHPKVRIKRTAKVECRHGGQIEIGSNTEILDYALILTYGGTIKIGEKCSINPFCVIYGHGGVVIGNHVLIAAHTVIIPSGHNFSDSSRTIFSQGNNSKGIVIEDDVWIGSGCKILDGVTIGRGAVIGAGAVVNKSIEAYSIAVGVPAHIVKKRGDGPFNRS